MCRNPNATLMTFRFLPVVGVSAASVSPVQPLYPTVVFRASVMSLIAPRSGSLTS